MFHQVLLLRSESPILWTHGAGWSDFARGYGCRQIEGIAKSKGIPYSAVASFLMGTLNFDIAPGRPVGMMTKARVKVIGHPETSPLADYTHCNHNEGTRTAVLNEIFIDFLHGNRDETPLRTGFAQRMLLESPHLIWESIADALCAGCPFGTIQG